MDRQGSCDPPPPRYFRRIAARPGAGRWMGTMAASERQDAGSRRIVRIFQSYGWHDATEVAQRLKSSLAEAGFDVWLDREQLRSDDKHFSLALEEAVRNSEVVIALLSPHSVRGPGVQDERSSICYNEIRLADELPRPIVPVRVCKFSGPPPFLIIKYRRIDWLDWEDPRSYQRGIAEILATIDSVLDNDRNLDPDVAFQATNFTSQLRTAREDFTGRSWLFRKLESWLEGRRRCFLIEGATGHGKTSVVAELVRRNPGGRILAYHFCSPVPVTLDPSAFVRSLAGMLANSIDAYAEQLWNGRLAERFNADPQTMLSQGVLALLHGVRMEQPGYIVVDALDEALAPDEAGAGTTLPDLLAGAIGEFPDWLKLVVTSRPHAHVRRLFRQAEICSLGGEEGEQRADLRDYVERRLAEAGLSRNFGADEAAREAAAGLIVAHGEGSFLYAGGVLDDLESGEIGIAQLDQLPRSLEALYYRRLATRFGTPPTNQVPRPDFALPRLILETLLGAREPLEPGRLAAFCGREPGIEVQRALDALSGFVSPELAPGGDVYRIAHKSVSDWLDSPAAGAFRIDIEAGRRRILARCRGWRERPEPYALRHLIAHLLDEGAVEDAVAAVAGGLFTIRLARLDEPRLDAEDARNLTLALVAARSLPGIVALARTENIWQRDGVAAALQSAGPEDRAFIDEVVGALLALSS